MARRHAFAVLAGLAIALAGVSRAGAKTISPGNLGPYQAMADSVGLTLDQRRNLAEQYAKMQTAQRAFLDANQKAWAEANAQAADGDLVVAAEGRVKAARLQAKYDDITAAEHAKAMAILTKEQALKWEQQTLWTAVESALFPVTPQAGEGGMTATRPPLDGVQKKILGDCCAAAARAIQAWPNPYDPVLRKEAVTRLIELVRQELAKANVPPAAADEK